MSNVTIGIAIKNILPTHSGGPPWYTFLHGVEALTQEDFHLSVTPLRRMSSGHLHDLLQFERICEVVYPLPIARHGMAERSEKMLAWLRRRYLLGTMTEAKRRADRIAHMVPSAVHVGTGGIHEPTVYTDREYDIIQHLSSDDDPAHKSALDSYHLARLLGEGMTLATLPLFLRRYPDHVASMHLHLRQTSELKDFLVGRQGYAEAYLRAVRGGGDVSCPIVVELGSQRVTTEVALELLRRVRKILEE